MVGICSWPNNLDYCFAQFKLLLLIYVISIKGRVLHFFSQLQVFFDRSFF